MAIPLSRGSAKAFELRQELMALEDFEVNVRIEKMLCIVYNMYLYIYIYMGICKFVYYIILCYIMLYYVILCYIILYHVILYYIIYIYVHPHPCVYLFLSLSLSLSSLHRHVYSPLLIYSYFFCVRLSNIIQPSDRLMCIHLFITLISKITMQ